MRKLTACLMALGLLISGCTFNVEVITPAPPMTDFSTPQPTAYTTQMDATPVATISATPVPPAPTLAPPTTNPIFFNGRSSATPDDHITRASSFPAGTKIVYMIWDYQNMRDGMLVRREWYLNGQPWLVREEPWDFAKYGTTGTMRDVSIHDDVNGLDSGIFHFRVYIDNVLQPIGGLFYEPIQEWVTFKIGSQAQESFMGYGSWDGNWGVEVYGGNRVVLKNVLTGESNEIVIVQEVAYVTWFQDSRHFLFVDRDRSEQKPGSTLGIRDHLWIVDVPSGAARRIYRGEAAFAGRNGPVPSLNGKYIASVEGSGYADACFVDSRLIFFAVTDDFNSATVIRQQEFSGFPNFDGGMAFPLEEGYWESESSYSVVLEGACNSDRSMLGNYTFNVLNRSASQVNSSSPGSVAGDLGVGKVYGTVIDTIGNPVAGATVTCEHHSYSSTSLCSGTSITDADGAFVFSNVFFHDTDTIRLTVQAPGYETREVSQSSFTLNDWNVTAVLVNTLPQ